MPIIASMGLVRVVQSFLSSLVFYNTPQIFDRV